MVFLYSFDISIYVSMISGWLIHFLVDLSYVVTIFIKERIIALLTIEGKVVILRNM